MPEYDAVLIKAAAGGKMTVDRIFFRKKLEFLSSLVGELSIDVGHTA